MNQTLSMNKIIVWDPSRIKEIDEAKRVYREYKALGYTMLKSDGTPLDFFHPSHGQFTILEKKSTSWSVSIFILSCLVSSIYKFL